MAREGGRILFFSDNEEIHGVHLKQLDQQDNRNLRAKELATSILYFFDNTNF